MTVPSLIVNQNGVSQVSADNFNTYIQGGAFVATLRAFVGISGMEVGIIGFTSANDGGQGFFYWNASGTGPDDNGVSNIVPTGVAIGCWTRLGSGTSSTIVNSITNSDGSLVISPTTGNVVASLGKISANGALANPTTSSAQPVAVSLTASTVLGRGPSGNIAAIPYSAFIQPFSNFNAITGNLPTAISGTNTTATITVSSGLATDSTNAVLITGAGYSWAVSNGNAINGYSGGTTLPNSSTIHIYICTGATGTGLYGIPNSSFPLVAASAPVGYNSNVRRVFSFITNSSGSPLTFNTCYETEGGSYEFYHNPYVQDVSNGAVTSTRAAFILASTPLGIRTQAILRVGNTSTTVLINVQSISEYPITASVYDVVTASGGTAYVQMRLDTTTTSQIAATGASNASTLQVYTMGYKDWRRS